MKYKEVIRMSKDISTQYTKEQNKKCGRRGYGLWKHEKQDIIPPKDYGIFIQKKGGRKKVY